MKVSEKERIELSRNQILKGNHVLESSNAKQKRKKYKNKKNYLAIVGNFAFYSVFIGFIVVLFLLYGPYNKFRDWYITTAMTTMNHQYLATWFYSSETINDVLDKNKMIEINSITDPTLVTTTAATGNTAYANEYEKAILERDPSHPDYKIIDIKGDGYSGYLAAIYDPTKIHTLVTSKLNVSGQYIVKMAEDNKATLAINGGFFVDLKEDRTGGSPLGITIANGKIITSKSYTGEGGLIGFDDNGKLILGKMSVEDAQKMNIQEAVTCGPFLIINGESSKVLGNGGWGTAPRTAIAQRKDGIVLMLVIDGRKVGRAGASMEDLIEIMQNYGAYNAAALDGGTSSVMVENYKIINDPIDSDGVHKTRPVATGFGLILDDDN